MNRDARIFVAGGATLLGAAIRDALRAPAFARSSANRRTSPT